MAWRVKLHAILFLAQDGAAPHKLPVMLELNSCYLAFAFPRIKHSYHIRRNVEHDKSMFGGRFNALDVCLDIHNWMRIFTKLGN